jgi:hypothetical protein
VWVGACGGEDDGSFPSAKARAVRTICDHASNCQLIGPGLTYETLMDCRSVAAANVDLLWPADNCKGRISQPELETCITAIGGASCLSASDFFDELSKCQATNVCALTVKP